MGVRLWLWQFVRVSVQVCCAFKGMSETSQSAFPSLRPFLAGNYRLTHEIPAWCWDTGDVGKAT